jgi:hypothetical protein
MQFKLFSIPATGDDAAEEELNLFLRSHRAVSVQRELVQSGARASWCFCIELLAFVRRAESTVYRRNLLERLGLCPWARTA